MPIVDYIFWWRRDVLAFCLGLSKSSGLCRVGMLAELFYLEPDSEMFLPGGGVIEKWKSRKRTPVMHNCRSQWRRRDKIESLKRYFCRLMGCNKGKKIYLLP